MLLFCFFNIVILLFLSAIFSNPSILVVGIVGLLLVMLLVRKNAEGMFRHLAIIFFVSVVLMLLMYYGYTIKYGTPYYIGGSDDLNFEGYTQYIVSKNYLMPEQMETDTLLKYHNSKGFLWILSWIWRLSDFFGGYHTMVYRTLNIYFLMSLGILTYNYFVKKYNFKFNQNLVILYAVVLFPNSQYINVHVFRDTLNVLILFAIFYILDEYFSQLTKVSTFLFKTLLMMMLVYASYWIRTQNIIFIGLFILLNLLIKDKRLSSKNYFSYFITVLLGVFIMNKFGIWGEVNRFSEHYSDYILSFKYGLSSVVFNADLFPFGIILRVMYGLISPIPLGLLDFHKMIIDIDSLFSVLVSFGVIVQIYMLPYLLRNITYIDKTLITYSALFLGVVITTFTFRHFLLLYPFMMILIFRQYFNTESNTKKLYFLSMTFFMLIATDSYFFLKILV